MTQAAWWEFFRQFILAGGGAALMAYGLFKWLGQKWIEDKFAQRLEQQRHDNAQALAEAKVKWDTELQGRLKYQEREFTSVGEAWRKLQAAYGLLGWLTNSIQQYPNVGSMNENELEEYLAGSDLLETQKEALRIRENLERQDHYSHVIFFHRYARVEDAVRELSVYTNENFPFIPDDLFVKFSKLVDIMYKALTTMSIGRESGVGTMVAEAGKITTTEVGPLFEEIKLDMRSYMNQLRIELSGRALNATGALP